MSEESNVILASLSESLDTDVSIFYEKCLSLPASGNCVLQELSLEVFDLILLRSFQKLSVSQIIDVCLALIPHSKEREVMLSVDSFISSCLTSHGVCVLCRILPCLFGRPKLLLEIPEMFTRFLSKLYRSPNLVDCNICNIFEYIRDSIPFLEERIIMFNLFKTANSFLSLILIPSYSCRICTLTVEIFNILKLSVWSLFKIPEYYAIDDVHCYGLSLAVASQFFSDSSSIDIPFPISYRYLFVCLLEQVEVVKNEKVIVIKQYFEILDYIISRTDSIHLTSEEYERPLIRYFFVLMLKEIQKVENSEYRKRFCRLILDILTMFDNKTRYVMLLHLLHKFEESAHVFGTVVSWLKDCLAQRTRSSSITIDSEVLEIICKVPQENVLEEFDRILSVVNFFVFTSLSSKISISHKFIQNYISKIKEWKSQCLSECNAVMSNPDFTESSMNILNDSSSSKEDFNKLDTARLISTHLEVVQLQLDRLEAIISV